jgi:hypothetical protein
MDTKQPGDLRPLVSDLALFAADVLSMDEVAARAGLQPPDVVARMSNPELLALVEREAVKGKLSGTTGQLKAIAIRDKALSLLAAQINDETSTRTLLDVLNTVRQIAARDDKPTGSPFSLVINMSGGDSRTLGAVVDVDAKEIGGEP